MKPRARELVISAGVILCAIFLLLDSGRWYLRADLSRGKAFTISPVSRAILRQVPDQVHITYYVSDSLRSVSTAPGRIMDLLQEYAAQSGGRVTVTSLDPLTSGRADSARRFGILPQQIQIMQENQQRTMDVFSGIVIEYLDRYTTLPAVFTADGLEYSLGLSVRKLAAGRRIAVGVLVGDPSRTFAGDYQILQTALSRDYSLREILPGQGIPPEVDVLIVAGGMGLPRAELSPINAYLMAGGRVLFAVKGVSVDTRKTFRAASLRSSALLDMLQGWGVRVERRMVLDAASKNYRLPQQDASGRISWENIARYPPWVSIQAANVSTTSPITRGFTGLDLLWPSPLEAVAVPGVQEEALATSSASSWTMKEPFVIDPFNVPQQAGPSEMKNRLTLVYALTGRFPNAFGTGESAPTRILVVGDDDFLTDLMQFSDSLSNVFFVENAILWLSGNEDLLSLKTRAPTEGRLDRIEDPVARGNLMLLAEILNVVILPGLVLLAGLVRAVRRSRQA